MQTPEFEARQTANLQAIPRGLSIAHNERARNSLASSLSWSFHSNKMSLPGTGILKKMLIYDDQSQYVYENKRNIDKMTAEESDIYGDMTRILQKNSGYDGTIHLE